MVYELNVFFQGLGLDDDQEERVIHYVDQAVEESLTLLDAGDTIFHSFEQILASLKQTVEKQNQVIEHVAQEKRQKASVLNRVLE